MRKLLAAVLLIAVWAPTAMSAGLHNVPDEVIIRLIYGDPPNFQDQHGEWWSITLPPLRYFEEPYEGEFETFILPQAKLTGICGEILGRTGDDDSEHFGCALVWSDRCDVYVAAELPTVFREHVLFHELAHCRGWGEDHSVD